MYPLTDPTAPPQPISLPIDSVHPKVSAMRPQEISNTSLSPLSNIFPQIPPAAGADGGRPEITADGFLEYLRNEKPRETQARVFKSIKLGSYSPKDLRTFLDNSKTITFNGDIFHDLSFYWHLYNPKMDLKNCLIIAKESRLNWCKFRLDKNCWDGTTIDGLYDKEESELITVDFSGIQMRGGALKNLIIKDCDSKRLVNADFSESLLENITFKTNGDGRPYRYRFINVHFDKIIAAGLTFVNTEFSRQVSFKDAKINGLILSCYVDLSGAIFDGYKSGDITLSDAMFFTRELIHRNLKSYDENVNKAILFRAMATLKDEYNAFRVDWAEQLVSKLSTHKLLSQEFFQSFPLKQSVIRELQNKCYAGSPVVMNFLNENS